MPVIKQDTTFDQYIETPWNIIESYFKGHYLEQLVRHQLESYNMFVNYQRTPFHYYILNGYYPIYNY